MVWQDGDYLTPTNLNAKTGLVFNVKDAQFGALGNNSTSDYTALQSAFSTAYQSADANGLKTIYIPPGRYLTEKPIIVSGHGIHVVGTGQGMQTLSLGVNAGASQLVATHQGGPLLLVTDSANTFAGLAPTLVSGSTSSAWNITNENCWINFRDLKTCDLSGLTAFSVELFSNTTFVTERSAYVTSQSSWLPNDPLTSAFRLYSDFGKPAFDLHVSTSSNVSVSSSTSYADGATHFFEASYDGASMRLFADGQLQSSLSASGTLVQEITEDITMGAAMAGLIEQALSGVFTGPRGRVDSVRLSNVARHTTNYTTPTSKLTSDAYTLALCNFDQFVGPTVRVQTKDGDGWLKQRDLGRLTNTFDFNMSGVVLDSQTNGAATLLDLDSNTEFWNVEHCAFNHPRVALSALHKNKFQFSLRHVEFHAVGLGTSRYGLILGSNAGIGQLDNIWFWGLPVPYISAVGLITGNNVFFQLEADSVAGPTFLDINSGNVPAKFTGMGINTENGVASNFRAGILVAGGNTLHASGLVLDSCTIGSTGTYPCVIADGGTTGIDICHFTDTAFHTTATTPNVTYYQGFIGNPIIFENCYQPSTSTVPWVNDPRTAALITPKVTTVASATTPVFDASKSNRFYIKLYQDVTSSTLTRYLVGQELEFTVAQDSAGSRAFVWPTNVLGGMSVSTSPRARSTQKFRVDSLLTTQAFAITGGTAVAAPAPTTLTDVDDLVLWLNAGNLALASGSSVTLWNDASGFSHNAGQTSAVSMPIYQTNVLNSQPSVLFNGSTRFMTISSSSNLTVKGAYSAFAVVKPTVLSQGIVLAKDLLVHMHQNGGGGDQLSLTELTYQTLSSSVGAFSANSAALAETIYGTPTLQANFYMNGTSWGTSAATVEPLDGTASAYLGYRSGGLGSSFWSGHIMELALYRRACSASERTFIESVLTTKYGL